MYENTDYRALVYIFSSSYGRHPESTLTKSRKTASRICRQACMTLFHSNCNMDDETGNAECDSIALVHREAGIEMRRIRYSTGRAKKGLVFLLDVVEPFKCHGK